MKKLILLLLAVLFAGSVLGASNIVVTSPNSGEEAWPAGSRQLIAWTFTTDMPEGTLLKLVLFKGGTGSENKIGNIVQNIPIGARGSGSYEWMAGRHEGEGRRYRPGIMSGLSPWTGVSTITATGLLPSRPVLLPPPVRHGPPCCPPPSRCSVPTAANGIAPATSSPSAGNAETSLPSSWSSSFISTHLGDRDLRGNILPPRVFEILVCPACPSDFGAFDYAITDRIAGDRYMVSVSTVDHSVSDLSDSMFADSQSLT